MNALISQLQKRDWYLLGLFAVLTVVTTYVTDTLINSAGSQQEAVALTVLFDQGTTVFMGLMLVSGIAISYYCIHVYGGQMAKGFYMFIFGFLFQLTLPIEVAWHLQGLPELVGPAWAGISPFGWFGFFHGSIAVSMLMMGYGLYLLILNRE